MSMYERVESARAENAYSAALSACSLTSQLSRSVQDHYPQEG